MFGFKNNIGRYLLLCLLLVSSISTRASHIFGIDLYYSYVSGYTYKVYLVVYGDCSGSAFPTLSSATPEIQVYNGNTLYTTFNLAVQAPSSGVEVTPVCPAQAGNTTCVSTAGTIPGIKKFVYSANVTLSGASSVWRFMFKGTMGATSSAGRSNSITNIIIPTAGSAIQLVDTLNNVTLTNSSSVYTTIPTPFYCIDQPVNFNPGAVDPDGDSLVYYLVAGMDASTGSAVTYISPYTATAPLATAAGTFSFNSSTGQLAFTPNIAQKSLVVYNVEEYRGGILRGTSQREMTVVVLSTCTNSPPSGTISAASAGTASGTDFTVCANVGTFTFHINPTDPNGDSITMSVSGLPTGATLNIANNGSTAPLGTFSWNTAGVTPGTYTFYITYLDNGCPLASKQTEAYTITIAPVPTESVTVVSTATCVAKAVLHITPSGATSPYTVSVFSGTATVHSFSSVTGMITDSLGAGTYTIRTANSYGCYKDTAITLAAPVTPTATVSVTSPLCPGGSTGTATVIATSGLSPFTYAIGAGSYSSSGVFSGLSASSYIFHIKDANSCVKDTTVTVPDATPIHVSAAITSPLCNHSANGSVTLSGYNSIAPYTYALGSGTYSSTATFGSLTSGSYTFHVQNANGCIKDTTITLADSVTIGASLAISPVLCNGGTGTVTVTGTGSPTGSYTYAYNAGSFSATSSFSFVAGTYTVHVKDANACYYDTTLSVTQPTALSVGNTLHPVSCNVGANGSATVTVSGGTPAYTYSLSGGAAVSASTFSSLAAGSYTVVATDANGCSITDTFTIAQPAAIVIDSVVIVIPTCNGGANGTAHIYAHGGTPSLTYANGSGGYGSSAIITSLVAGSYTLHVKDANACIKDTIITVGQPAAIAPTAIVHRPVCSTLANGSVALSATGGTPVYSYAVGGGAYSTASAFSPLAAGTYTFHIKDANACVKDTSITLTDSLHVSGTFTIAPTLCYGSSDGAIAVTGTGGSSPYMYASGSGAYSSGGSYTGLTANSYIIHIKDNNGCIKDTTVAVTQPTLVLPHVGITQPQCHGNSNGSVNVWGTGGTPAYQFAYNAGAYGTTTIFTGIAAGIDTVWIRDANGCTRDTVIDIGEPSALVITSMMHTNITCHGGNDGTVTMTAAGAIPAYEYAANTGSWQTSNVLTGLSAGIQAIHVEDSHGCAVDTSVTLTEPTQLVYAGADTVNPTCEGYTDGSVTLHVAGGVSPYHYSDDNITYSTSGNFTALAEGNYTFYTHDANGCAIDTTITLTGLPHILIGNATADSASCYGAGDGKVTVVASGGVAPLSYWLAGTDSVDGPGAFSHLYSGSYVVTVTDNRQCKKDTTVFVPQPDELKISFAVTPNDCQGYDNTGAVAAIMRGGTAPYTYAWSMSTADTNVIGGFANGIYTVTVTDAHKCTITDTATVEYDNCCKPFIPNAFTPNWDGHNDIFRILHKGDMVILEFSIFNRFGERVFYTQNENEGWDGIYKGQVAEMGTYYYFARIICGNHNTNVTTLKGDVTLVR